MLKEKIDYFIGLVAIFAFFLLIAELSSYFDQYAHIIRLLNIIILAIFILDVCLSFSSTKNKKAYIKHSWVDFIVFVPLIQFIKVIEQTTFFVIIWQAVIILMLFTRLQRTNRFITLLSLKPAQLMITSFAFAICGGAVLLMLPASSRTGIRTPFFDALFTATSATCVTGLTVKDTALHFSLFGQLVILFLIQIGGLGIMTFSVSLVLLLRKRIEMQGQIVMQDVLEQDALANVKGLVLFILKMTVIIEIIGAISLFIAWEDRFPSILATGYHAVFHSISAFCNAGFSSFSDNLMGFSSHNSTNIIICLLIISGGLGFTVIKDIHDNIADKLVKKSKKVMKLKVQTRMVLGVSVLLILMGALIIYVIEDNNSFSPLTTKEKILTSLFQSITARTAGFNTCDISKLSAATLFIFIILMFIGGSPGSTAGGVKTTTVAVLWAVIVSGFKDKENIEVYRRTIPQEAAYKAITVFLISILLVVIFVTTMLYVENKRFIDILFETVSAFGTVGLSTGITPQLSDKGKFIITLLMFIGRLGPLTIGYAFTRIKKPAKYIYAEEKVMIG